MKYNMIFSILLIAMLSVVCSAYAGDNEITTTTVTTKTVTTKVCCEKKKVVHKRPRKQHVVKRYIAPVERYEPIRNEWRRVEVIQTQPQPVYQIPSIPYYNYSDYYSNGNYYNWGRYYGKGYYYDNRGYRHRRRY